MRAGLLGGVFDPPHRGHTETLKFLIENNLIDSAIVVPSYVQPLKPSVSTSFAVRMKMACAAFEGMANVAVNDIEGRLPHPSYTINTLRALSLEIGVRPAIIIGYDQAEDIKRWYRYEDLCREESFIIVNRDSRKHSLDMTLFKNAVLAENSIIEISSTDIREMVSSGEDVSLYLDRKVIEIIERERLYIER